MTTAKKLHEKALRLTKEIKICEADLISVLRKMDKKKYYRDFNCRSLFDYAVQVLNLSESRASNFITVSRMCDKAPEIEDQIRSGELSVSKVRKICSVLTKENKKIWLLKAKTLSQKLLEREVAAENPKEKVQESLRYISKDRLKLVLGLSEAAYEKLERVLDLESQKKKKSVSIEDGIESLLDLYLEKQDPVRKAKRSIQRKAQQKTKQASQRIFGQNQIQAKNRITHLPSRGKFATLLRLQHSKSGHSYVSRHVNKYIRQPLSASLQHEVYHRDLGRCQMPIAQNKTCGTARWIHLHHIQAVSQGGENSLDNLITLCSAHHAMVHEKDIGLLSAFRRLSEKSVQPSERISSS